MGTYKLVPSGGTYSLKYFPSLAEIFGPGEDIRREALVERLVARRRAPGEDAVAEGCAGAPSNFIKPPTSRTTITVSWPDTPAEEQAPEAEIHTAIWWDLEEVRVENPEDSEQYVITKRIKQARYQRPNGTEYQQDYRPILTAISAS